MAPELLLGQLELGTLLGQLGLEVVDRETPGIEFGLLGGRVDLDQQLALADLVAGFDVQLADLPGGLGAHVDVAPRLQGAQRGDAAFDIGAADRNGTDRQCAEGQGLPGQQAAQAEQAKSAEKNPTAGRG
ncbi:hypothetical protein D3C76_823690 [compost metagenome]